MNRLTERPWALLAIGGVAAASLSLAACRVEQTREGALPDVDVDVSAGQLPEYEIQQTQEGRMPDVDVDVSAGKLPEYEVETPDIEVERKTVEVPYPDIDLEMPGEDEAEEAAEAVRERAN